MQLAELKPRFSPPGGLYQEVAFLCPKCSAHEIMIAIWSGNHGNHKVRLNGLPADQPLEIVKRLWHAEVKNGDWQTLTVTPSVDRTGQDPCGGWHGFITNGRVE